MNRKEFMDQLEKLLSDISEDERREALDYYESYFDEAGEAEEASVIQKLGSPGKVAAIIKADLKENSSSAGTYTEKGYYDERTEEPGQVPGERTAGRKDRGYRPREKRGSGMMILVLILLVFLSPFLSGAIGGVVGFIVTIILTLYPCIWNWCRSNRTAGWRNRYSVCRNRTLLQRSAGWNFYCRTGKHCYSHRACGTGFYCLGAQQTFTQTVE